MNPQQHPNDPRRVKAIFTEAMQQPPSERAAFIARACAGDATLQAEVDMLAAAMTDAAEAGFFAAPTDGGSSSAALPTIVNAQRSDARGEGPGTVIGPYKLLQLIGEGGFGEVFMAEQSQPVQRRVALKIIKAGMDTKQVIARFEQERQALAVMDHANIAKVLDAGATDAGRPFFVMELVKGEPITDYCDKNNLSIVQRLELFAQVCNAIQHAHQKGIIHRDIKPSNILVSTQDGKPMAKALDFGVAKATAARLTEKTLFTEHRTLIGTPEYMSPEQAEGSLDIDTRTDVYSLGVLLYELLTGATPFDSRSLRSAAFGELQRIIREVDPPKPSTRLSQNNDTLASVASSRRLEPRRLSSIIRGELDWIVMKALEKDRARRYETANGLAMDIARYLAGEAVVAAPPSTAYRFSKFVKRHRSAVLAGGAVAAALLVGVIAFAWQARIARQQRDLAIESQRAESQARRIADEQRDRAFKAEAQTAERAEELTQVAEFQASQLGDLDVQLMGKRLRESLLGETDPAHAAALAQQLDSVNFTNIALDSLKANIFDRTLAAIEKDFADQPLVRARLLESVAMTLRKLGLTDRALDPQQQALGIRRRELGDEHADTLASVCNVGVILEELGRLDEAAPFYAQALDGRTRTLGENHPEAIASLSNSAYLLMAQGRYAESEAMYRLAVDRRRKVLGSEHRETLMSVNGLGYALILLGRVDEAEPLWRESYETGKRMFGGDDPDVIVWINNMGGLRASQGDAIEAERFYREALEANRRVRGDEHPDTLSCIENVARSLRDQARFEESLAMQNQALATRMRVLGPGHPDTLRSKLSMASVLRSQGKAAEAEPLFREVLQARQRTLGGDHADTITAMSLYASVLQSLERYDEAERYYLDALASEKRVLGAEHPDTLVTMNNYGGLLIACERYDEAGPLLREALAMRRKASGDGHPETLILMSSLGLVLSNQGKPAEAEPLYVEALAGFIAAQGPEHPNTLAARNNVATALMEQGKFALAEPIAQQATADYERVRGKDFVRTAGARTTLARTLTGLGKYAEAQTELMEVERALGVAKPPSLSRERACAKAYIELYEQWDAAEPGQGYDGKAAEWKAKLDAMIAATQPATSPATGAVVPVRGQP